MIVQTILITVIVILILFFLAGIRIIRPTHRVLIETLGRYTRMANSGFTWIVPIFQASRFVNITEQMSDLEPQELITKDNLNCRADLVVFYKIKPDEKSVCYSQYNVGDVISQLDTIARTTARNVIGNLMFKDVNSKRNELNSKLREILIKETKDWGVEVLKVELKDITPPESVQESMNRIITAENEKDAAIDFAQAKITEADGRRGAAIKEAEGLAQGKIIVAKAEAERIKLVNEAANKYFIGNARLLRQIDMTEASLKDNSKIILTKDGINPQLIIGNILKEEKDKK